MSELELLELFDEELELELLELFEDEFELELLELFDDEFELELLEPFDEEFELELLELLEEEFEELFLPAKFFFTHLPETSTMRGFLLTPSAMVACGSANVAPATMPAAINRFFMSYSFVRA